MIIKTIMENIILLKKNGNLGLYDDSGKFKEAKKEK